MNGGWERGTAGPALVTALLCLALTAIRAQPPEPAEESSHSETFSAVRAGKILADLYSDIGVHPIGTEANRRLKDKILDRLRRLGYQPEVQETLACWEAGGCGQVENVLARLEGSGSGKAVLLAVHYDGVGAGPSVADNGVAVAASLEIAGLLAAGPPLSNDVIFLIDDGEEAFLLGAVAFAAQHPWARDVGAVVNLEARGSGGSSYMFETGPDNAWLIDLMRESIPRPATSSFYYSIYQRLPNDTDFTVFRRFGMNGVNFAFIRNVVHYHTPLDDLRHASAASLQHHGENALAMVRALADTDLDSPPEGTASWFDLWGFGILTWPESRNLALSVLGLSLAAAATGLAWARGRLTPGQVARAMLLLPTVPTAATLIALAVAWLLRSVGDLPAWPAVTWAPIAAFWSIGLGVGGLTTLSIGRRCGSLATWLSALIWSALLSIPISQLLPGATYLFFVPALVGGLLTIPAIAVSLSSLRVAAIVLTVFAACAAQMVLIWNLWDAMGITIMPVVVFFVASLTTLVLGSAAETWSRNGRRVSLAVLFASPVLVAVALLTPAYSPESPRPLNIYFVQDSDAASARLAVAPRRRPLPEAMVRAVDWGSELTHLHPWSTGAPAFRMAEIPPIAVEPPRLEAVESEMTADRRTIRARLISPRGANQASLAFADPGRVESIEVGGWEYGMHDETVRTWSPDGRQVVRFMTLPRAGIDVELVVRGQEPLVVWVTDSSFGLPASADPLIEARPDDAVPIHRGDLTLIRRRSAI